MDVHSFFLYLILILLSARLAGELAAHIGVPSVIGEIAAGIVLGPSMLGIVPAHDIIKLLAEIGIIMLLFEVGLETDISELKRAGRKSVTVALAGFVLPFLLGFFICRNLFGLDSLVSLFVGGTMTATSIGITIRVLADLKRQNSHEAQVVLGAAVLDDIMGVVLLALLYEFSVSGGVSLVNTARVLAFIGVFMILAPILARFITVWIKKLEAISQTRGVISTTIVSLVLFFAWLAHQFGAPQLLGGFAAGLALSRRFIVPMGIAIHSDPEFAAKIENDIKPIIHLFTPLFFVMVGLSLDFSVVDWGSGFIWYFSSAVIASAVAGKLFGAFMIKDTMLMKLIIGLSMVPRGEVGLIFAELGRASGVFTNEIYAALVIVIAATTIFPPFLLKFIYRTRSTAFS